MQNPGRPIRTSAGLALTPLLGLLLILATVFLGTWQLVAGVEVKQAARWIERAEAWESVLWATAQAIEDGSLTALETGGFRVPWEGPGDHPFPISIDEVQAELTGMTAAYPDPLEQVAVEAEQLRASHDDLALLISGLARMGPLASLTPLPQGLRVAALATGRMIRPIVQRVGREGQETGLARLALAIIALLAAALAFALALGLQRAARDRDRLARHVLVLEQRHADPTP